MTYIQTTSPRTAVFYGESMADLALMPTTTKIGEGEYIHALAQEGSYAIILLTDGLKKFMLRSTGWVEVKDQGGGGGSWFEPGGNTTFAELPTPSKDNVGIVYNITDAFTTDERFNEGAGIDYPAGTNVAIVNVGTDSNPVYKFDTYAGAYTIDDELSLVSENPVQNKVITSEINAINTTLSSLATVATSGSYADLLDKPIVNCTESEYEEIVSELEEGTIVNIYDVHKVLYVGSDNITAILPFWIGTTAELASDLANIPEGFIIIVTDGATQTGVPVNYNLIVNHPTINGVEVVGSKTAVDLGIINDNTASNTTTYSSNKINQLATSKKMFITDQALDTTAIGDFWAVQQTETTVDELYLYGSSGWEAVPFEYKEGSPPSNPTEGLYWALIGAGALRSIYQYQSGTWVSVSDNKNIFKDTQGAPTTGDQWIKVNNTTDKTAEALYTLSSSNEWVESYVFGGAVSTGSGLEYDAQDNLKVKLGTGLKFDANGAITLDFEPTVNIEYGLVYQRS